MVSQYGIQLATHLVSSFYGDLCSKVCECLLHRGTLTLPNIMWYCGMGKESVTNCLRVLIHQNCVQAFAVRVEGGFGDVPKVITNYMALFDNIIHKMRAPKFLQIVSVELDNKGCLEIFQWLLQHGRLSMNQIISRNKERKADEEGKSDDELQVNFRRLLSSRFIERCPLPEPFLELGEAPQKKGKAKKAKTDEIEELTIEQRALLAACPMNSMRFLLEVDDFSDEKVDEIDEGVRCGMKRKQDVVKLEDDVLDADKMKEVVWRVNFEEFVCRLRHEACVSCVKEKVGEEASIVLGAILGLSRGTEWQKANITPPLSLNAIYDEIIKQARGLSMDLERTQTGLAQLDCQTISDDDDGYSVDLNRIIGMAQIEEVESVVLRRYGREAYRIFRLLIKKVQLLETRSQSKEKEQGTDLKGSLVETNKISDAAMVDKKDTIKNLYKLWKDDYVHMEKVTTSAKPPVVLLWKVKKESLRRHVLDEMYHAALNLRLRDAHELNQAKQALVEMENTKRVRVILQTSLIELDDSIMLFHDF